MAKTISELGDDLFTLLSAIVNGGDDKVRADPNNFVSWCMPGLPFEGGDFEFAAKGFGGGGTAEEEKKLLQQAYSFATLIDFIPDPTAVYTDEKQDRVWRSSQARMSHMYGQIIQQMKVPDSDLSEAQRTELERLRGLLRTTRKNLADGTEVLVDSPIVDAYNQYMAEYIAAKTLYNNKRIAAAAAVGPEGVAAVNDFALNGGLYQMQANNALRRWESQGYKQDIEDIFAKINDLTGRSAKIWKQKLIDAYEDARVKALGPGQEFFYTTVLPSNFAASQGWQTYKQTHEHKVEKVRASETSWKAQVGLKWKIIGNANAAGTSKKESEDISVSTFTLSFEFTQLVIARSFFFPELFMHRGWTLEKGRGWMFDEFPSDGGSPPKGLFIGYPTTVLMARNIVIESTDLAQHLETFSKTLEAGGGLSIGCLNLSGSYAKSESGRDFESTNDGNKITVPGMQIIGFINRLVGKAPEPLPDLVFEKETEEA